MSSKKDKAVLLTGAAARISQEVAILDALMDRKKLRLTPDDTYLAGFSSGSLNVLALNLCFGKNAKINWDQDYKEKLLFPLTTKQVFQKDEMLPFNTEPLRATIEQFLASSNATSLKDYSFDSQILVFSDRYLKTYWPGNTNETDRGINLVDLHMASTAIPFLFPWQEIKSNSGQSSLPDGHFQDGGTGGIFKRFEEELGEYVKKQGAFKELYIISPMRYAETLEKCEFEKELEIQFGSKVKLNGVKDFLGDISQKGFVKFLKELKEFNLKNTVADKIFVSVPELVHNFPLIDFDYQRQQYDATKEWVEKIPEDLCLELDEYLERKI